jgi:hypothetical protein
MITKTQFIHLIEKHRHAATGNELFYYRDLINIELERIYEAPREWVEAEPNTKGMRLRDVLNGNTKTRGTVIFHTEKPFTSNPVWEILGQT